LHYSCFRFRVDSGNITYIVTICSDASKEYTNSSAILKQGKASTVLGRYNDTDVIGRGMEIRRPISIHCCFFRLKVCSVWDPYNLMKPNLTLIDMRFSGQCCQGAM
jgi:hypothetical protein